MCESNLCQDYERAGFRKRDWVDWKKRRGLGKPDIIYVKNFATMSAEQEVKEPENTGKSTEVQKLNFRRYRIWTTRSIKSRLQEVQDLAPIYTNYNTTLQLFHKKISYRTFWCIMNLAKNITKESDPVRQKHYTTKKHWLVDFINIFWFILKLFLFQQQIPCFCWYYPYWLLNPRIPSVFFISIFYQG